MDPNWIASLFEKHLTEDDMRKYYQEKAKTIEELFGADVARVFEKVKMDEAKEHAEFAGFLEGEPYIENGFSETVAQVLKAHGRDRKERNLRAYSSDYKSPLEPLREKYMDSLGTLVEAMGAELNERYEKLTGCPERASKSAMVITLSMLSDMVADLNNTFARLNPDFSI